MRLGGNSVLVLAVCAAGAIGQERLGPLETAVKFFEANRARRCAEAFSLYTKGAQENIRAQVHRAERERDGEFLTTPETANCDPSRLTKRGSARVVRQSGDEAIVTREYSVGHWLNKYIRHHGIYYEGTEDLRLVREDGAWRVERPRGRVGRERSPGERLVEVGRVDVSTFPHNRLGQDVVDATAVARAPREKIESVLRDPVAWGSLFPLIQTVDVLETNGDSQRIRLVFTGSDRPVIVTVKTPGERIDRLRFDAGHNMPVMFWGWWNLSNHHDGTRIALYLVINKKQWPGDMGERLLAPERIAEAVLGLEQAALKK